MRFEEGSEESFSHLLLPHNCQPFIPIHYISQFDFIFPYQLEQHVVIDECLPTEHQHILWIYFQSVAFHYFWVYFYHTHGYFTLFYSSLHSLDETSIKQKKMNCIMYLERERSTPQIHQVGLLSSIFWVSGYSKSLQCSFVQVSHLHH